MLQSYTVTGSKMQETTYFKSIQNDTVLFHFSYLEVTIGTTTGNYFVYNSECYGVTL